jgi:hypothetical protein
MKMRLSRMNSEHGSRFAANAWGDPVDIDRMRRE